jgi:DNA-binding MarR family transcriptional regulator
MKIKITEFSTYKQIVSNSLMYTGPTPGTGLGNIKKFLLDLWGAMTVSKTKTEIALELGRAMTDLKNHLRRNIQLRIREHGIDLTFEMLEILSCLWKKDGVNQQELADLTLRDKSGITYLIDNLVKREIVTRVEDEKDRRNRLVFLTEKGLVLKDQLKSWGADLYDSAIPDIDAQQLQDSLDLVNKMIANVKAST